MLIDKNDFKKEIFVKCFCLEKIIARLTDTVKNDKRKSERKRASVALENINQLAEKGVEEYEKQKRDKMAGKSSIILPGF